MTDPKQLLDGAAKQLDGSIEVPDTGSPKRDLLLMADQALAQQNREAVVGLIVRIFELVDAEADPDEETDEAAARERAAQGPSGAD